MLSPDDPVSANVWTPTGPIPPAVRAFGKYPNVAAWLPGDLVLVSHTRPDWIARQIQQTQVRGGYSATDALWQHAAIYAGDSVVLEATRLGVAYAPLANYVGHYRLRVRRDPNLTPDERWRLVVQAGFLLKRSYAFSAIVSLFRSSFSGFWQPHKTSIALPHRAVICSQLYGDAYTAVTGRVLAPPLVTPAALSQAVGLQDVGLRWDRIG